MVHVDDGLEAAAQGAPKGTAKHAVVVTAVTGCAAVAVAAAILILIIRTRRMRRQESDQTAIIKDMPGFVEASFDCTVAFVETFCVTLTHSSCNCRSTQPRSYRLP